MKARIAIFILLSHICLNTFAVEIDCLSEEEAKTILVSERKDGYFSLLQPREIVAKTGQQPDIDTLQALQSWTQDFYRSAVSTCTGSEYTALKSYVSAIESRVGEDFPGLFKLPWRFIKISDEVEGGLPHTAGNAIVLSESMLQSIEETADSWQLELMNLLVHEQVHVLQRANIRPFEFLYKQKFGFQKVARIEGSETWLEERQVVNPDGEDVKWVWRSAGSSQVIWPRLILSSSHGTRPRMPSDFMMVGIELTPGEDGWKVSTDENGQPRYQLLRKHSAYREKFPGISSLYHPNEIAADYIADLVVWDCLLDKTQIPQQARADVESVMAPVRPWVEEMLGN